MIKRKRNQVKHNNNKIPISLEEVVVEDIILVKKKIMMKIMKKNIHKGYLDHLIIIKEIIYLELKITKKVMKMMI